MIRQESKGDMCLLCFYGSSGRCIEPGVVSHVRNNLLDMDQEVKGRIEAGECPDASESTKNPNFQGRDGNKLGLRYVAGHWRWLETVKPLYGSQTQNQFSERGRENREASPLRKPAKIK